MTSQAILGAQKRSALILISGHLRSMHHQRCPRTCSVSALRSGRRVQKEMRRRGGHLRRRGGHLRRRGRCVSTPCRSACARTQTVSIFPTWRRCAGVGFRKAAASRRGALRPMDTNSPSPSWTQRRLGERQQLHTHANRSAGGSLCPGR